MWGDVVEYVRVKAPALTNCSLSASAECRAPSWLPRSLLPSSIECALVRPLRDIAAICAASRSTSASSSSSCNDVAPSMMRSAI